MDIMYMYTIPGSNEVFGIRATGTTNSWNMTDEQKSEYVDMLFTGVISYIKRYWAKYGALPERNAEIYEGRDFVVQPTQKTSCYQYVLDLV